MYVGMYVSTCTTSIHLHLHLHIHICIYVYIHVHIIYMVESHWWCVPEYVRFLFLEGNMHACMHACVHEGMDSTIM